MKNFSLISILLLPMVMFISIGAGCTAPKDVNMPVVLLTDFGIEDYRVLQLKGIILNSNPGARVIDACHSVPAFDVCTGAYMLDIAAREFPESVVFIAVIAPYTQPVPEYLVLTNAKNQIFVLPDNGLLTYVVKDTGVKTVYKFTNGGLFDRPVKDLVAERIQGRLGALIAAGYQPKDIGIPVTSYKTFDVQEPAISGGTLLGTAVYIDHFGNAVTNISRKVADEFGLKPGDSIKITTPQAVVPARFGTIYSDVAQGEEVVFVSNNLDMLQLSINLGNFADKYKVTAGTRIKIEK
ncbi:MAG: SAM-dependent chlorinase/fluorinase [Dehalococcoidia bacterium]|nr:SAM-dependent chlorinase/fluorinase [Dehalococcoidia bacterium]MDD5494230.1 SAM-dependent chlorinase/fluorinase [Dehalococcoidia bacterium]